MDLQFRKGIKQDRQAVADLLRESQMEPEVDPDEFLLAFRGEKLAGAIRVENEDGFVYIRPVVVAASEQGAGVGRALVQELAKTHPVLHVVARGSAVGFYRQLGFTPQGWADVPESYREECDQCPDQADCEPLPLRLSLSPAEKPKPAGSTPVITFIGKSGSGKTTLLEKVIRELVGRGYRLAAVKHHSHSNFEIDVPGKDSWRFAQAGSEQVVISAPEKLASYRRLQQEESLDEIIQAIHDVDLILVEGYKKANKPTVEVIRSAVSRELMGEPTLTFAVVSDIPQDTQAPFFHLDDFKGVADLIEQRFLAALDPA